MMIGKLLVKNVIQLCHEKDNCIFFLTSCNYDNAEKLSYLRI